MCVGAASLRFCRHRRCCRDFSSRRITKARWRSRVARGGAACGDAAALPQPRRRLCRMMPEQRRFRQTPAARSVPRRDCGDAPVEALSASKLRRRSGQLARRRRAARCRHSLSAAMTSSARPSALKRRLRAIAVASTQTVALVRASQLLAQLGLHPALPSMRLVPPRR